MKKNQGAATPIRTDRISSKSLIFLTFPAALSAMLNNAYRVIDQHAVQWLGVDAQAAIASCTFVLIAFFAGYTIFASGAISLVARAVGSEDVQEQKRLIGSALTAAALAGIVILGASGTLAPWTVRSLGLQNDLAKQAETYLRWHAVYCLPQAVMPTLDAIFIAYGRTKVVLVLQVTASALNFLLNPVCIYALDFGIGGAAMATGISQTVAVAIGLILLSRTKGFDKKTFRLNNYALKIIKVGLPMCWGTLVFAGVYWALLRWVISPLGPAVNAALGIGFSVLEGFTWPVFWGFSMGIASIVGRCLGAGELAKAKQAIHLAFRMMTLSGLLASAVFWWGAEVLSGMFTNDAKVLEQAVLYAQVLAFSQLFVAYEALAEGILSGAGKTKAIFYWSAPLNILRIPCCWLFAIHYGYGAVAVWWVINISTILKSLGKWSTVISGRWQS
ncbi:MATE family efflux transporter [Methyloglobulus sp.]|uniref:MATE family efflux transporter n=1 Tax=Methyloglobulus sp. TaxID=2518622 RepID=UPI003988D5F0